MNTNQEPRKDEGQRTVSRRMIRDSGRYWVTEGHLYVLPQGTIYVGFRPDACNLQFLDQFVIRAERRIPLERVN